MGFTRVSPEDLKLHSIFDGGRKVSLDKFGKPFDKGISLKDFLSSFPMFLGAKDLFEIASWIRECKKSGGLFVLGMGAHPIKVGISPFIIDLVKKGILDAIATNGASMIHDLEISIMGRTSEDVAASIRSGTFGMGREIGEFLNKKLSSMLDGNANLGETLGKLIDDEDMPYKEFSLFWNCYKLNVPITVHVAIGTDITHMQPSFDAGRIGRASYNDFLTFVGIIRSMEKGFFLNLGSAVIIPEVFLKAISMARNMGSKLDDLRTCVFDFIKHYRPMENVVRRPVEKGYYIVGHHEILFPLFYAMIIEEVGSC